MSSVPLRYLSLSVEERRIVNHWIDHTAGCASAMPNSELNRRRDAHARELREDPDAALAMIRAYDAGEVDARAGGRYH